MTSPAVQMYLACELERWSRCLLHLGLAHYSQVDMLGLRYNFGAERARADQSGAPKQAETELGFTYPPMTSPAAQMWGRCEHSERDHPEYSRDNAPPKRARFAHTWCEVLTPGASHGARGHTRRLNPKTAISQKRESDPRRARIRGS